MCIDVDCDDWCFVLLDVGGYGVDVIGVCFVWIVVVGFDLICDVGIGYVNKLCVVKVLVELKLYEGMIYDFFKIGCFVLVVEDVYCDVVNVLCCVFGIEIEFL